MREGKRWVMLILFAVAMAWVESAAVVYLRTLVGRIEPYRANPLPNFEGLGHTEIIREGATLLMLMSVGWLAGRSWPNRLGYFAIAFGVWDISYYVFLRLICGWPHSVWDWDVLFLMPLPWWGPVIAPVCIAALMVTGGTLITQCNPSGLALRLSGLTLGLSLGGIVLALYVFMADALRSIGRGLEAIRHVVPTHFNWPLFWVALLLIAAPVVDLVRQLRQKPPGDRLY